MAVVPCLYVLSLNSCFFTDFPRLSTAITFGPASETIQQQGGSLLRLREQPAICQSEPNFIGRMIRNKSSSANERRNVISPEQYPFPYAIIRTAAKILIPKTESQSPWIRIPDTAMENTGLVCSAKQDTPCRCKKVGQADREGLARLQKKRWAYRSNFLQIFSFPSPYA